MSVTSPQTLAYHEAGHVVVAAEVGGRVLSASIEPDADDHREADVVIDWPGGRSAEADVWVALGGPVAETIYEGHMAVDADLLRAWSEDWRAAAAAVRQLGGSREQQARRLRASIADLDAFLRRDDVWAVVGDLADALLAHESLEEEMIADVLTAWGMA